MKNNQKIANFGQNTRILEVNAASYQAKRGLWPSRPTPKGPLWP